MLKASRLTKSILVVWQLVAKLMNSPTKTPRTQAMLASVSGGKTIDGADSVSYEEDFQDKALTLCRNLELELSKLLEVCHKRGWNGVENSKLAWVFLENELSAREEEIKRLREALEAVSGLDYLQEHNALANLVRAALNPNSGVKQAHPGGRWS